MKKVLSIILAIIIVITSLSLFAFAREEEVVPVVVLQGYSGPTLVYADENGEPIIDPETGDVVKAWPVDFAKIGEQVIEALPGMVTGKIMGEDAIVEALVPIVKDTLMPLVILEDGTSWQNLTYYPKGAAATQVSALIENDMEEYIPESVFVEEAVKRVGAENVFGFTFDWRRSQLDYAKAVDEYIQEVKKITGSDKVDIMGLSHGGQYGTTYLYYYGHKNDVRNAILANPATGGTTFVSTIMMEEYVDLDLKNIMKFVEYSFDLEEDLEWIFDLLSLDNIVGGINRVLQEDRINYRLSQLPSLLDFVPMDRFQDVIEKTGLNAEDNPKIYYDTVKYHNDIHSGTNLADKFAQLQKQGTKIGYVVGCGYTALSSVGTNSDFLIDTYLSSGGATCAPYGETFEAGYVQKGTVCSNPKHYHISPEFNIDATTGALPDSTWYVSGQGHGQYFNDPYTRQIVCNFLWEDLNTVFDDDRFPQFNYSQKHADNIYVRFNNTDAGYHSSKDTQLIIKNLSNTSKMHIWTVDIEGADADYALEMNTVLKVGDVQTIELSNVSPETADKPFRVVVKYSIDNTQRTFVERAFSFIAVSDEELGIYSHLINNLVEEEVQPSPEEPTTEPEEPTTEQDEPTTEAPTQTPDSGESTTGNGEITEKPVIPNTDDVMSGMILTAIVICSMILVASGIILRKRKIKE